MNSFLCACVCSHYCACLRVCSCIEKLPSELQYASSMFQCFSEQLNKAQTDRMNGSVYIYWWLISFLCDLLHNSILASCVIPTYFFQLKITIVMIGEVNIIYLFFISACYSNLLLMTDNIRSIWFHLKRWKRNTT